MASSYIPKYQFQGIMAKRQGKRMEFKYQQLKKNGEWGAVRTMTDEHFYKMTPQQILDKLEQLNPGKKYRLA